MHHLELVGLSGRILDFGVWPTLGLLISDKDSTL